MGRKICRVEPEEKHAVDFAWLYSDSSCMAHTGIRRSGCY